MYYLNHVKFIGSCFLCRFFLDSKWILHRFSCRLENMETLYPSTPHDSLLMPPSYPCSSFSVFLHGPFYSHGEPLLWAFISKLYQHVSLGIVLDGLSLGKSCYLCYCIISRFIFSLFQWLFYFVTVILFTWDYTFLFMLDTSHMGNGSIHSVLRVWFNLSSELLMK